MDISKAKRNIACGIAEPSANDQTAREHAAIMKKDDQTFHILALDGGLWANNPTIIAPVEAVSKFDARIERVHILSIGTGRSTNFYSQNKFWGLLTGWGRQKLVSYVLSLQSQASTNMSKLILGDIWETGACGWIPK